MRSWKYLPGAAIVTGLVATIAMRAPAQQLCGQDSPPLARQVSPVTMRESALCPWDCGGDNGGVVGITDFLELLANWGPCP